MSNCRLCCCTQAPSVSKPSWRPAVPEHPGELRVPAHCAGPAGDGLGDMVLELGAGTRSVAGTSPCRLASSWQSVVSNALCHPA